MNGIIALLSAKDRLSVAEVKRVYKALCKKLHPDSGAVGHDAFVKLREEYLEALAAAKAAESGERPSPPIADAPEKTGAGRRAHSAESAPKRAKKPPSAAKSAGNARHEDRDGFPTLLACFDMIGRRDQDRYFEMARYILKAKKPEMLPHIAKIVSLLRVRHDDAARALRSALSVMIGQLGYYKHARMPYYRAIFDSYARELPGIAGTFPPETGKSVEAFSAWLASEFDAAERHALVD